ncbi:alpha/beta hydrolase family esterase [Bradyrhizobium sp. GCM10027634]|uniref:alpha/beta hydrolase family esterase n=1 Tax=unclassified Bradyrhizobium TaxID=2631580 RepID=UPI001FED5D86|nr:MULTISPECIES: PHB depolymerase family esterase [unclassified Bradyrhizobium]MDN5004510.1 PHB depolymerase family esterase [Bradyrhizobium sp. WYCCWR 12677]
MRSSRLAVACIWVTALISLSLPARAFTTEIFVDTRDGPRHALVMPAGDGPHPTVIVLHGALGTGAGTARLTGFAEAAARHSFTAVFPDGLDRKWHDGRAGGPAGPDDVGFIRSLVGRLIADHLADRDRIYLAGISNGGMMSFTLLCKAPELFAGVGTVIANMPAGIESCPAKPVPVVMINGTADPMVPYNGGGVGFRGGRGEVWSVRKTAEFFARRDGCSQSTAVALPSRSNAEGTSVTRISWRDCRVNAGVTLYRVEGGGHALPGRRSLAPRLLGRSNFDIESADVILDAFELDRPL